MRARTSRRGMLGALLVSMLVCVVAVAITACGKSDQLTREEANKVLTRAWGDFRFIPYIFRLRGMPWGQQNASTVYEQMKQAGLIEYELVKGTVPSLNSYHAKLTDVAKQSLPKQSEGEAKAFAANNMALVPVCGAKAVSVTGVHQMGNDADVELTIDVSPFHYFMFLQEGETAGVFKAAKWGKCILGAQQLSVKFQRFDDGWRLMSELPMAVWTH